MTRRWKFDPSASTPNTVVVFFNHSQYKAIETRKCVKAQRTKPQCDKVLIKRRLPVRTSMCYLSTRQHRSISRAPRPSFCCPFILLTFDSNSLHLQSRFVCYSGSGSGVGAYVRAARRRVHLATVLLRPPSGHRPGRRQPPPSPCPHPSDRTLPDATMKRVGAPSTWTFAIHNRLKRNRTLSSNAFLRSMRAQCPIAMPSFNVQCPVAIASFNVQCPVAMPSFDVQCQIAMPSLNVQCLIAMPSFNVQCLIAMLSFSDRPSMRAQCATFFES